MKKREGSEDCLINAVLGNEKSMFNIILVNVLLTQLYF